MTISIIDYGVCNSYSVKNMINRIGYPCNIINSPSEIKNDSKLILPGIGSFDNGIKNLKKFSWDIYLKNDFKPDKQHLLCFCLGMQLLFNNSEEGNLDGLALISGNVRKLKKGSMKIPNMGWRNLKLIKSHPITNNILLEDKFYFVHSYFCDLDEKHTVLAESNHAEPFPAIIEKQKIIGCQFHPEKSNIYGMKIIENFINL